MRLPDGRNVATRHTRLTHHGSSASMLSERRRFADPQVQSARNNALSLLALVCYGSIARLSCVWPNVGSLAECKTSPGEEISENLHTTRAA